MAGATPMREVTIVTGDLGGTTTLSSGPCAGTTLDLADADARRNHVVTARTDSSGTLTFAPASLGRDACSQSAQALDLTTCEVTPVVPMTIDCSGTSFEDGLIAYWPGDGNAQDVVGRHDGTIEGTVDYAPGVVGDAFELDGWSAVKVRPYADLDFGYGQPFTYAMWVYNERTSSGPYHILGKRHLCGPGPSFDYQYLVQAGQQGLITYECGASAAPVPPANEWQHIVAGYDGSAFFVYVDGEPAATSPTCAEEEMPVLGGELRIGSSGTCGTINRQGVIGLVDEVMLWNRTLTDDEIACAAGPGPRVE
jgi:hypothetical protein